MIISLWVPCRLWPMVDSVTLLNFLGYVRLKSSEILLIYLLAWWVKDLGSESDSIVDSTSKSGWEKYSLEHWFGYILTMTSQLRLHYQIQSFWDGKSIPWNIDLDISVPWLPNSDSIIKSSRKLGWEKYSLKHWFGYIRTMTSQLRLHYQIQS